ncbi:MAG: hypothetical protein IPG50_37950 [Myxococcales bacterium]|nr:hypothetical protein [Myxococcales bacterium]
MRTTPIALATLLGLFACKGGLDRDERAADHARSEDALTVTSIGTALCSPPRVTQDGRLVLHDECATSSNDGAVVVVSPGSGQRTVLTQYPANRKVLFMGVKGARFFYAIDRSDGGLDLHVRDTTNPTQVRKVTASPPAGVLGLTGIETHSDVGPEVFVEGNQIVFFAQGAPHHVFVGDLTSSVATAEALFDAQPHMPMAIAGVGSKVMLASYRDRIVNDRVRIIDMSGTSPSLGAWTNVVCAGCDPGAIRIDEHTFDGVRVVGTIDDRLVSIEVATGLATLLDPTTRYATVYGLEGGFVYYGARTEEVRRLNAERLVRVPLAGGAAQTLFSQPDVIWIGSQTNEITWSSDKTALLFEARKLSGRAYYVMPADGSSPPQQVATAFGRAHLYGPATNGRQLVRFDDGIGVGPAVLSGILDDKTGQVVTPLSDVSGGPTMNHDGSAAFAIKFCTVGAANLPGASIVRLTNAAPVEVIACEAIPQPSLPDGGPAQPPTYVTYDRVIHRIAGSNAVHVSGFDTLTKHWTSRVIAP